MPKGINSRVKAGKRGAGASGKNARKKRGRPYRPPIILGSFRKFESFKSYGIRGEFRIQRRIPLLPNDHDYLREWIRKLVRVKRIGYKWMFVSIVVETVGPLYESKIIPDEEDIKSIQTLSTPSTNRVGNLLDSFDLLLDKVDLLASGRKATLKKIRPVFYRVLS